MAEAWPLAREHGPFLAPEVADKHPVCEYRLPTDSLIATTCKTAAEMPIAKRAELWRKIHFMTMHKDCRALGKVPTTRTCCFDAQRCVHEGAGRRSLDLTERLRYAFIVFGASLGLCTTRPTKKWNNKLQSGTYVCRFQRTEGDAEATLGSIVTIIISILYHAMLTNMTMSTSILWCHRMVPCKCSILYYIKWRRPMPCGSTRRSNIVHHGGRRGCS